MEQLNFFPYYEELLRGRLKTTTFRVGDSSSFSKDEKVIITVGWEEVGAAHLHPARITSVYRRKIAELTEDDFRGESPDCQSREASRLVLSCLYRTVLPPDASVWVVKFNHLDS